MDQKIQEQTITTIECECSHEKQKVHKGNFKDVKEGIFHYKVYLPEGYHKNKDQRYPCIFISLPGGNANFLPSIRDRMIRDKWIVIMLVEAKNGPWGPVLGNFLAAHDDAVERFRIQEGMKYATGFSGGARACSNYVQFRDGFSGVILQGAGLAGSAASLAKVEIAVYMIMGDQDSNFGEVEGIRTSLPRSIPFKSEIFKGGHKPGPKEAMERAFDWLEEQILIELPTKPALKPYYITYFKRKYQESEKIQTPFAQYEALDKLLSLAKKRSVSNDKETKDLVKHAGSQLRELSKDTAVRKEVHAKKSFEKVSEKEKTIRKKFKDKTLKRYLVSVAKAYVSIAKQFPSTKYGKEARKKYDAIVKEFN
jgi:hypothetical protein